MQRADEKLLSISNKREREELQPDETLKTEVKKKKNEKEIINFIPNEITQNVKLINDKSLFTKEITENIIKNISFLTKFTKQSFYEKKLYTNLPCDVLVIGSDYFAVSIPLYIKNDGNIPTLFVQNLQTNEWHLLKKYPSVAKLNERIQVEKTILKRLDQLVGEVIVKDSIFIVKKYIPGENLLKILKNEKLNLEEKIKVASKIIEALMQFHKEKFIHCDIKLENILYDSKTGKVTLIDFDVSLALNPDGDATTEEFRGSPGCIPPEIIEQAKNGAKIYTYNAASDLYCLGLAFEELFNFKNESNTSSPKLFTPSLSSAELKILDIIKNLLAKDPKDRLSADQALTEFNALHTETTDCSFKLS